MTAPSASQPLIAPRALLLDFGGVVVSTTPRADWARTLADTVLALASRAGFDLDRGDVEASLIAGREALSLWKNASSRRIAPRELAPREIVEDFLLVDLPPRVRSALALEAGRILAAKSLAVADHHVRPGIRDLLAEARGQGIAVGIVSNAHAGGAHRAILRDEGLDGFIGVQVYSDEVGIRKPHPGMIKKACGALGVAPEDAWYVGDTVDRDVVAGRRAGAGRVIITRDRRTDRTPFPVTAAPDLVLDTPEGLVDELRRACDASAAAGALNGRGGFSASTAAAAPAAIPTASHTPLGNGDGGHSWHGAPRPLALLLDHGGVLTSSVPDPDRDERMGRVLVDLADRCGHTLTQAEAATAVARGWDRHRARKRENDARTDPAHQFAEIEPAVLWGDLVGAELSDPLRAALRIEATELSYRLHRIKGAPTPREGALELVRWAHERGIVVGIVSNTISGRGVRDALAAYGIIDLLGPSAYSDEVGVRKPGAKIFDAALAGLDVPAEDVVYVGDKAFNDGLGGRSAGIGTVCLLRGGKDDDAALDAALADGTADHVLDGPGDVIGVLEDRLAMPEPARP